MGCNYMAFYAIVVLIRLVEAKKNSCSGEQLKVVPNVFLKLFVLGFIFILKGSGFLVPCQLLKFLNVF